MVKKIEANAASSEGSERLHLDLPRFCFETPSHANAINLRAGSWRYGIDTQPLSELRAKIEANGMPALAEKFFSGFSEFDVIELGPQDGYLTAILEAHGVRSITAIEANADNFLHCLILKNALGLKATYLLGDFLKFLESSEASADLVYASGVMYHLRDPLRFLELCAAKAPHLYLWTFHYDAEAVAAHAHESLCFAGDSREQFHGEPFTYHKRHYAPTIKASVEYSGGIHDFANWLTMEDIRRALDLLGYTIHLELPDQFGGMPAMNIWASRNG